jgi:hypothetical protein
MAPGKQETALCSQAYKYLGQILNVQARFMLSFPGGRREVDLDGRKEVYFKFLTGAREIAEK